MKHAERRALKERYIKEIWDLYRLFQSAFKTLAPIPEKVVNGSLSLVHRYKETAEAFNSGRGYWFKRGFGRAFKVDDKASLNEIEREKKRVEKTARDFGLIGDES